MGIWLIIYVITYGIPLLIPALWGLETLQMTAQTNPEAAEAMIMDLITSPILRAYSVIVLAVSVIGSIAIVLFAKQKGEHPTKEIDRNEVIMKSLYLILPLLGLGILIWLWVILWSILLILPWIYLAIRRSMANYAMIIDGHGIMSALSSSSTLIQWKRRAVFWRYLVFWLLIMIVAIVFMIITWLAAFVSPILWVIINIIYSAFVFAITVCFTYTLYEDLKKTAIHTKTVHVIED